MNRASTPPGIERGHPTLPIPTGFSLAAAAGEEKTGRVAIRVAALTVGTRSTPIRPSRLPSPTQGALRREEEDFPTGAVVWVGRSRPENPGRVGRVRVGSAGKLGQ